MRWSLLGSVMSERTRIGWVIKGLGVYVKDPDFPEVNEAPSKRQ